jgi:hypothetical protein
LKSENRILIKNATIIILISGLIIIIIGLANDFCPVPDPIKFDENATVLKPDSLVQVSPSEISSHNSNVRDFLVRLMEIENVQQVAHQTTKTQMRGFYLVTLAGLLALLLRFGNGQNKSSKKNILIILSAALVTLFYGLEVHDDDLFLRYRASFYVYSTSATQLSDSFAVAKTWQSFDYGVMPKKMEPASKFRVRWPRMLRRAIQPGADQIALYILPLISLGVVGIRTKKR